MYQYHEEPQVISYEFFREQTASALSKTAKNMVENGWQPLGAPFCDQEGYYCQAMVKYGIR